MKSKKLSMAAATLVLAAVAAAPAMAKPPVPFQPGANCHGQTVAFLAQESGGFSKAANGSPKELQQAIREACALINANPGP